MAAILLLAAHGTRSATGTATTHAIAAAVRAARPDVPVALCFLDVASPSLRDVLDELAGTDVVVVPLLLSAGFHVTVDIPRAVADRSHVRVAQHLGPEPAVISAVADRLAEAGATQSDRTVLAAVESSRETAHAEVASAAAQLSVRLGQTVEVLPLRTPLRVPDGANVAVYLLAEGEFRDLAGESATVVAAPIGAHPAIIELIWKRYDAVS